MTTTLKTVDALVLGWLATWSIVTFLSFGFDKWRATRSGRRIPELTLVMMGAIGGWPGGLLGMNLFRHKSSKGSFQIKYALGLIPFCFQLWIWWRFR
ncbi:MAG TPA: DUF1294 domain-containing protein [Roseimicrobium sp.]|nr:DUF1294 domain-containing protein [Roseimicrobium sp.]